MTTESLPDYPAAVLAAARAAELAGRLPAPTAEVLGDVFPYEADLTVVPLEPPVLPEPDRADLTAESCGSCRRQDSDFLWTSEHFRLAGITSRMRLGVHGFMLWTRQHGDLTELAEPAVAELGPVLVAVERAITEAIDGVGRVHLIRWGDGSAHLHWWFLARPVGLLQLRGTGLTGWLDVLPPLPDEVAAAGAAAVADRLAAG